MCDVIGVRPKVNVIFPRSVAGFIGIDQTTASVAKRGMSWFKKLIYSMELWSVASYNNYMGIDQTFVCSRQTYDLKLRKVINYAGSDYDLYWASYRPIGIDQATFSEANKSMSWNMKNPYNHVESDNGNSISSSRKRRRGIRSKMVIVIVILIMMILTIMIIIIRWRRRKSKRSRRIRTIIMIMGWSLDGK